MIASQQRPVQVVPRSGSMLFCEGYFGDGNNVHRAQEIPDSDSHARIDKGAPVKRGSDMRGVK